MSKIIWKPISGWENKYEVSNDGRVRSRTGMVALIKTCKGYFKADLYWNKKRKQCFVHRLMCDAFLGENKGMFVNHINGEKSDNRIENLEWVTHRDNARHHAIRTRGSVGVRFKKNEGRWVAYIKIKGKVRYFGWFHTKEEAIAVYNAQMKRLGLSGKYCNPMRKGKTA